MDGFFAWIIENPIVVFIAVGVFIGGIAALAFVKGIWDRIKKW